jgi:dehydrogenase/reductase SDR family protein 7B
MIFLILISSIGASSGIGRELVKELHRISPTTRLVISARRENELKSLADELNLDSDRCLILPLDLEIHDYGFQSKLHLVLNQFGRIDVLINNAGISQRSLIKDTIYTVDSRLMNINFLGTITLSKTVLSVNRKRKFSLIIFILKTILAIY